jgi:hypothetical protein
MLVRGRWIVSACALAIMAILAAGLPRTAGAQFNGPVLDQAYLNVPFERQDTLVWCWVAAAKMVARYYNVQTPSQCQMLQAQYRAPCCSNPAMCTRPGYITEIQALIASFGLRFSQLGPPTDGWSLLSLFKRGSPVVLYVNNSHFVVASGMRVVGTHGGPVGVVRILDPYSGPYEEPLPSLYQRWGAALYVF